MIKETILLLSLLTFTLPCNAQYYSRIIPFPFGNPTVTYIQGNDSSILIPVIYPEEVSTLIEINGENVSYHHINNFVFALGSLNTLNAGIFIYAKDRDQQKALKLGKWQATAADFEWINIYDTHGIDNFPTVSTTLKENIFLGYITDFPDGFRREFGLIKVNSSGDKVWNKVFNEDMELSYLYDIKRSLEDNLIISSTVVNYPVLGIGRFGQLIKLDSEGNIIWNKIGTEKLANGAEPARIAQLSNGNIVQCYGLDKWGDIEYRRNNWNISPVRMRWFDAEGNDLKEKLLINHNYHHVTTFLQVKEGRGDYFFTVGTFDDYDKDLFYGLVMKFNNEGDTIWAKRYQHLDYARKDGLHAINSIVELENGDIILAGSIDQLGEKGDVWLLRTDSLGCIDSDNCGDLIISDQQENPINPEAKIEIYPNPVYGNETYIKAEERISKISIYNTLGQKIRDIPGTGNQMKLNMTKIPFGIYIIIVQTQKGSSIVKKIDRR